MMGRPLRPPSPNPITTGLWGARFSAPQPVAAGDRMRGTPCLACGEAIGGGPAVTINITYYIPDTSQAGHLPCCAWLVHAHHRGLTPRRVHDLAEWRLGITPRMEDTSP